MTERDAICCLPSSEMVENSGIREKSGAMSWKENVLVACDFAEHVLEAWRKGGGVVTWDCPGMAPEKLIELVRRYVWGEVGEEEFLEGRKQARFVYPWGTETIEFYALSAVKGAAFWRKAVPVREWGGAIHTARRCVEYAMMEVYLSPRKFVSYPPTSSVRRQLYYSTWRQAITEAGAHELGWQMRCVEGGGQ